MITLCLVQLGYAQERPLLRHAEIADGRPADIDEGFLKAYETEHGFTLDLGDRLTLSTPLGSSASITAVAGGGGAGGVGGGAVRGSAIQNVYYKTVYNGTQAATMAKAVTLAVSGNVDPALFMAPQSIAGTEVQVVRIKLAGTKKRPVVWAECKFVNESDKKNASGIVTVGDVDEAVRLGEVVSPEHMTRDLAIARLKEAKELLDIGAYTQDQFDAERAKYLPYIAPGTAAPAPAPVPGETPP